MPAASTPAVFLDRDGTLIVEREYLSDPHGVELLPGVASALREFQAAGFKLVVITNQSGIARGYYTAADYEAVQARVEQLLAEQGITINAAFYCPHHPDFTGPCDCRKPGLALYQTAARNLGLDLARSIYVGDRIADVLPAQATGGRAMLVRTGYGAEESKLAPAWVDVVDDLPSVARQIVGKTRTTP